MEKICFVNCTKLHEAVTTSWWKLFFSILQINLHYFSERGSIVKNSKIVALVLTKCHLFRLKQVSLATLTAMLIVTKKKCSEKLYFISWWSYLLDWLTTTVRMWMDWKENIFWKNKYPILLLKVLFPQFCSIQEEMHSFLVYNWSMTQTSSRVIYFLFGKC